MGDIVANVKRVYVEKKKGFDVERKHLLGNLKRQLHIEGLTSVRILIRYDVQGLDEVVACYHTGGTYDYLLHVIVPDMNTYYDFVTLKLARLDNIHNVQSAFVLKEVKGFAGLPGPFTEL